MFTDKNKQELIKRLNYMATLSDWTDGPFQVSELQALLGRLEAAEEYIWHLEKHDGELCICKELKQIWRKAAGK